MANTPRNEQVATYNQTVGVKVDMDEMVDILTPDDVPLQQLLPNGGTTAQTKIEWMEDELLPYTVTVASSADTASPWTVVLGTDQAAGLRVGDVLAHKDTDDSSGVQFLVDSITDDETVELVAFGTTSATDDPAANDVLQVIGQYRSEGSDPVAPRSSERVAKYNVTQIVQEQVQATRTARHRGQRGGLYGAGDPYAEEVEKKFRELAIRFERSLVHGQRAVSSDSTKRFMGGLFYFITTNSTSGAKANINTLLSDAILECYEAGASGELVLMVSPAVKRIISDTESTERRTTRTDREAGTIVDTYTSDFGTLRIVPNRHFPRKRGLVLQPANDPIVNFDPYTHELLAKTGDADKGHIIAEKTLKVKNEVHQSTFTVTDA